MVLKTLETPLLQGDPTSPLTVEGTHLNILNVRDNKPTADIFDSENLNVFPQIGSKQGICSH